MPMLDQAPLRTSLLRLGLLSRKDLYLPLKKGPFAVASEKEAMREGHNNQAGKEEGPVREERVWV